jgi:peptidoglycan/xylan/chitin deacetylase (PgdA/CDA1 family)
MMKFRTSVKCAVFVLAKVLGLFALARRLTRERLRILGYHGFELNDEADFRPTLFMKADTFRRRLAWLAKARIPVLSLDEAVDALERGTLPPAAAVITIDDGFWGTVPIACEELAKRGFPATIYVTSYYAVRQTPIFRLAIRYLFWKTAHGTIDLSGLAIPLRKPVVEKSSADAEETLWEIIRYGEGLKGEEERSCLARTIAGREEVDYEQIVASRILSIMSPAEIRAVAEKGIDIQLHTHRHVTPLEEAAALREMADNRAVLGPLVKGELRHFCYPDGKWSQSHWPFLEKAGIRSAVTCDSGLNDPKTPRYALRRFLDDETVPQIEFEAELSGFCDLVRRLRGRGA